MNIISSSIESKIPQPSLDLVLGKTTKVIPMRWYIKALQFVINIKRKVWKAQEIPLFEESTIPDVDEIELADIDLSNPFLYRQGQWESYFKRLRDECPVHFQRQSIFGPFWSITRYEDIMYVEKNPEIFSSEPGVIIGDPPEGLPFTNFIAMDPPKHDLQRQAVQESVAPKNLKELESLIRSRTEDVLDHLPRDEPFDWVSNVSIELTCRMLATLFDFPYAERRKLAHWSDQLAARPEISGGPYVPLEGLFDIAVDLAESFSRLWYQKSDQMENGEALGYDLISLLLSNEDTKDMINKPMEFLGNLGLLIVGGNDTTRNSMSGGVLALNQFPDEFDKLKKNPKLIPNMVSEIIRWQTPLAHMRRVAKKDVNLGGQLIKKGDKVVMWYASGNRDERAIESPDQFIIDRKNARNHLSFGFGIHRCMGNRLAEMQLRILWEEILKRFENIELTQTPEYVQSNFVRGYSKMMVKLTPKAPTSVQ